MRALFLDRDGIFLELIDRRKFLSAAWGWEEVRFFDGLSSLDAIRELGFYLILVTNQPDIERGDTTQEFVESVNNYLKEKYHLDAVYVCPFASNDHPWKKPNPGMLLQAASDFNVDIRQCWLLGDTERDLGAAERAGCHLMLWERPYNSDLQCAYKVNSLSDVERILKHFLCLNLPK